MKNGLHRYDINGSHRYDINRTRSRRGHNKLNIKCVSV